MSRHYIELPANLPAGKAAVICGYDRHPTEHFFCNVSESLHPDHIDEPLWASMFDAELAYAGSVNSFDLKLANFGINLPEAYKQALRQDWSLGSMSREVCWNEDGTILSEGI